MPMDMNGWAPGKNPASLLFGHDPPYCFLQHLQWEWLYEQQEVNNQEELLIGLGIQV